MAEVEFGDSELFEQLDDEEAKPAHLRFSPPPGDGAEEAAGLRERVRQCEATIDELQAENDELRRKLNILTRPSGLGMTDSKFDGPLLQILFMNSVISKQYHQDIEDFVTDLVNKYEQQKTAEHERTSFNVKPQPSSIMLEEDNASKASTTMKKIKEAFSVVGSVLYFTNFCLDKLGQPILNENPQLTEGWEVPKYQQVFTQIVSLEGQELTVKAKRPKAHCFNCGSEEHQLRDCPVPRDGARISGKRKAFMDACGDAGNQNYQQRYHAEEVEERFARFKPGTISEELQGALGVSESHLPPFIYRMRQLGYPPGWLKEAELENSGLSLYDGKDASDGEIEDGESSQKAICVSYDLSKLVNYPGFNVSSPRGTADDWRLFNSIPMQSFHQKEVFANYLASTYPTQSPSSNKRTSASQSSPSEIKKQKMTYSSATASPVNMDIDSGRNDLDNNPDGRPPYDETTAVNVEAPGVCIQVSKTELPKPSPKIEDFLLCLMDDETTSNPELTAKNGSEAIASDENGQNGEPVEMDAEGDSSTKVFVPDMSKFAVGITPFEYDNMAESTGLYLRLRDVLKNSPRNQQKCKNLP